MAASLEGDFFSFQIEGIVPTCFPSDFAAVVRLDTLLKSLASLLSLSYTEKPKSRM